MEQEALVARALDVLAVYRYRVSQRGAQATQGRYGSHEWLDALAVHAATHGRERALEEVHLVIGCLREAEDADGGELLSTRREAEWLESSGRRSIQDALAVPDTEPLQPSEGRSE
jgi:hypothetical protein